MAGSIPTEALVGPSKDVKKNTPSPFTTDDGTGFLAELFKQVSDSKSGSGSGSSTPLSTLESIAATKMADSALKPYKSYISNDLKPIGVEDSVYNLLDVNSLYNTGDPRLSAGEVISTILSNFSERIDKYNEAVKSKDGSGADPGSLQISPHEVYSVFAKFKRDRFEQWDKGFVSFLRQKGPVEGMYTTPSNEYFVKVFSGEKALFFKYFYDRRYYIAKEFKAPKQIGEYFPIYPINNSYFTAFYDEADAFKRASEFHYTSPYGFTTRKETKQKASPQGLVY